MANNTNKNAISRGILYTLAGVECVKWAANSIADGLKIGARNFEAMTGNEFSFMEEWAVNQYPLLCNGWLLNCVGSHIVADGSYAVKFITNNAVTPSLTSAAGLLILTLQETDQGWAVTTEVVEFADAPAV